MDFFDTVEQRRSIRAFTTQPVEESKLEQVLHAANASPSAGNLQAYEIFVARGAGQRAALAAAALGQDFVARAPVVLVFCTHADRSARKYGERGERLYAVQDATISCAFAMLAVTALGLATVWVGAFDERAVWRIIGAPQGVSPVAMLPIGYAAERPGPAGRRSLQSLVHEV